MTPVNSGRSTAWRDRVPMILSITVVLCAWWAASASGYVSSLYLPSPWSVLRKLFEIATTGFMDATLAQHAAASLTRVGLALLLAVLTAIPLGMAMGLNRHVNAALDGKTG